MTIDEEMIICAIRYSLGRRTYIVGDIIKHVIERKDSLSGYCKNIIIRDVEEHLSTYKRLDLAYQHGMFENAWIELVKELKGEK